MKPDLRTGAPELSITTGPFNRFARHVHLADASGSLRAWRLAGIAWLPLLLDSAAQDLLDLLGRRPSVGPHDPVLPDDVAAAELLRGLQPVVARLGSGECVQVDGRSVQVARSRLGGEQLWLVLRLKAGAAELVRQTLRGGGSVAASGSAAVVSTAAGREGEAGGEGDQGALHQCCDGKEAQV